VGPNYENERYSHLVDSVKNEAEKLGATIINIEHWGKKRLAYSIDKQKYGTYVLMQFGIEEGNMPKELEAWMEITTGVLHQMTVRLEDKPEVKESQTAPVNTDDEN